MKKKFLSFTLAFVCVIGCLFCLTACGGDGDTKKMHWLCAVKADETPTQSSSHYLNYNLTYGETPDLTYKLYGYYGDDDVFREISLTDPKLTVKYYAYYSAEEGEKEVTAWPSNWVSGSYAIEYVYDGNTELKSRITVGVNRVINSAAFTIASVDGTTTWDTNDKPHKVRVINPQKRPVQMNWLSSNDGISSYPAPIEEKDDTDGHYALYLFKKNIYENFSATERADYEFLNNYFYEDNRRQDDHDVYYYRPDDPYSVCVGVPAGEYVLVALIDQTYNYLSSVSQGLAITITNNSATND